MQLEGAGAGRGAGLGEQQHRQPAPARLDGLARVRRDAVEGRAGAAPRPGRRLSAHGLRHPRQLPPRGRAHRPPQPTPDEAEVAQRRGRSWRTTRRAQPRVARPTARMSATTSSTPGRRDWSARWRCARRWRIACAAPCARRPLAWFAGAIVCATLLLTLLPLAIASHGFARRSTALPLGAWWSRRSPSLALLLSASQLAVAIVNWLVPMLLAQPRALPRMDFSFGIPSASRTLVVVPTMLSSAAGHRRAGRGARGALPRQPRRAPALRAADRLPRRGRRRRCLATRRCSRMRASASRR